MSDTETAESLTHKELERRLYEMGIKVLEKERIENEMERELKKVRRQYSGRLSRREKTIERMEAELQELCEASREDLLPDDKKEAETMFGRIGWRKKPSRVRTQDGVSSNDVAQRLERMGFLDLVKVKKKPDKRAVKQALKSGDLSEVQLQNCGLEMTPGGEKFWTKLDRERIRAESDSE